MRYVVTLGALRGHALPRNCLRRNADAMRSQSSQTTQVGRERRRLRVAAAASTLPAPTGNSNGGRRDGPCNSAFPLGGEGNGAPGCRLGANGGMSSAEKKKRRAANPGRRAATNGLAWLRSVSSVRRVTTGGHPLSPPVARARVETGNCCPVFARIVTPGAHRWYSQVCNCG